MGIGALMDVFLDNLGNVMGYVCLQVECCGVARVL